MLPTIDFKSANAGEAFVDSLKTYGFAAFENHPLDMDLVRSIYREWSEFFDSGDKEGFAMDPDTQDGYFSIEKAESAKGQEDQDFKEYYHYYPRGRCPEELKAHIHQYYEAAHELAATLLSWVEQYSPADIEFSEPLSNMIVESPNTLLRILRYPAVADGQKVSRAAAHEDINLLTILPAADGPGLQIMGKDGNWIQVENDGEKVLINIGDMLQEASGGFFPSTTHQVAEPEGEDRKHARMSLPLFLHPRPEVVLSERYTAGSYLHERLVELGVV